MKKLASKDKLPKRSLELGVDRRLRMDELLETSRTENEKVDRLKCYADPLHGQDISEYWIWHKEKIGLSKCEAWLGLSLNLKTTHLCMNYYR